MKEEKAADGGISSYAGNTREEDTNLSDHGSENLTLFEKKALLVNDELDAHGMGKYQWVSNSTTQLLYFYLSSHL